MSHSATTLWRTLQLGDFGQVVTGRTPPTGQDDLFGNQYPFITPTDMDYGVRRVTPQRFISPKGAAYLQRIMLPPRTPAFVCIGATIGKVCLTDTASFTNQQLNSIIVDQDAHDPLFVYYLLVMAADGIKKLAGGAATPIINKSSFSQVEAVAPPLPTQRRIASVLSAYDDLIENNTRRIAILEEMARRLYEEWFVQFRFPGHEEAEFVETELGQVPKEFEVLPLENVCKRITDGAHKSPTTTDQGKPMASVKDMHDWGFNLAGCRKIAEEDFDELVRNDCKPLVGDVLIAKDGSYLKHTFVAEKEVDLVILSSIAILRPNTNIRPNLLAIALRHPDVVARMKGVVSGVAIPRIVLKDFRKFKLVVPPKRLQEMWSEIADPIMTLCRRLVDKNANLRAQRDLLLPKLISGEIDVSNLPLPGTEDQAA